MNKLLTIFVSVWILLSLSLSNSYAESWSGKVIGISDGDTLTVMHDNQGVKIRLAEIDCPESGQPFGQVAKRFISDLCFAKVVVIQPVDVDKYGRIVANVILPDGYDLSKELLRAGLAWHYKKYSDNSSLAKLEIEARAAALGLWSQKDPIAPWEWRKGFTKAVKTLETTDTNQSLSGFHGNINSRVFHKQGCRYFNCSNCTVSFSTREEAIKNGYRPCKICNP